MYTVRRPGEMCVWICELATRRLVFLLTIYVAAYKLHIVVVVYSLTSFWGGLIGVEEICMEIHRR